MKMKRTNDIKIEVIIREISDEEISPKQRDAAIWLADKFQQWAREFMQENRKENNDDLQ